MMLRIRFFLLISMSFLLLAGCGGNTTSTAGVGGGISVPLAGLPIGNCQGGLAERCGYDAVLAGEVAGPEVFRAGRGVALLSRPSATLRYW
jgi:hypothetical protein